MGDVVENRDHLTHVFDGEDRVEHLALLAMMISYISARFSIAID